MNETARARTLVMTGGTSGIGAAALTQLDGAGIRVLVGARTTSAPPPVPAEVLPLDLVTLAGVRAFAASVVERLAGDPIDILVLNAGGNFSDASVLTEDGFERTFAVNHLAHYVLARLLLPVVADGGRIVITASDVHDPSLFPGAPTRLDVDGWSTGAGSTMHAYAASKLANVLTAQKLVVLPEVVERRITVIAYNPGLTPGTGLTRDVPRAARAVMGAARPLFSVISRFRPIMHMGTVEQAGAELARLADGRAAPPEGHVYASMVRGALEYPDPSELAQDPAARDELWRASAVMTGLPVG